MRNACILALVLFIAVPVLAAGPFAYYSVTPCRTLDTRLASAPTAGAQVQAGQTVAYRVRGQCGIPEDAKAIFVNTTLVNAGSAGWLAIYSADLSNRPTPMSSINWNADDAQIGNGALTAVSASAAGQPDLKIYSAAGPLHVIQDVFGYLK